MGAVGVPAQRVVSAPSTHSHRAMGRMGSRRRDRDGSGFCVLAHGPKAPSRAGARARPRRPGWAPAPRRAGWASAGATKVDVLHDDAIGGVRDDLFQSFSQRAASTLSKAPSADVIVRVRPRANRTTPRRTRQRLKTVRTTGAATGLPRTEKVRVLKRVRGLCEGRQCPAAGQRSGVSFLSVPFPSDERQRGAAPLPLRSLAGRSSLWGSRGEPQLLPPRPITCSSSSTPAQPPGSPAVPTVHPGPAGGWR